MFFARKKKTEVQVLKSTLVATFSGANPPLIWKFDLERNHSFTLALQGDSEGRGDEGEWELGVTSPKGEFFPIAHFLTREDADEAFRKLEQALANSQKPFLKKLLRVVIICGIAVLGFMMMINILRGFVIQKAMETSQMATSPSLQQAPVEMKDGVPLSADDVLKPPH